MATASFMVASDVRGRGVGTLLCREALDWARRAGYAGMQFNAVAAANLTALRLYGRLGFEIVGTVPGEFSHPTLGRVGLHVLYKALWVCPQAPTALPLRARIPLFDAFRAEYFGLFVRGSLPDETAAETP